MNKIDNVKIKSIVCFALISLTFAVCAVGCKKSDIQQNDYEKKLLGKWAYVHDTKETVAEFNTDGSAKFEGKKYQYTSDDQFIELTNDKEETKKLALMIEKFATGSLASFGRETNVDLNNKYIVLDMTEMTENLKPLGMFMALDLVWDKGAMRCYAA